jgi:methyltransferase
VVTVFDMGRALVLAVALERLAELLVSRRNARRLLAVGAVEAGRGHYPAMVGFHAALLVACIGEPALPPGPWPAPVAIPAAVAVLLAEGLRWWAVASLGGRWTTRVLVLPGVPPVRSGPYRWLRHPNYLAVIVEVAALPLAAGAWITAAVATVVNAVLLGVRIRAEEGAMGVPWETAFRGVGRFVPRGTIADAGTAADAAADADADAVADAATGTAAVSATATATGTAPAPATGTAPATAAYGGERHA